MFQLEAAKLMLFVCYCHHQADLIEWMLSISDQLLSLLSISLQTHFPFLTIKKANNFISPQRLNKELQR